MNVTYRGRVFRLESDSDIFLLCALIARLDSLAA